MINLRTKEYTKLIKQATETNEGFIFPNPNDPTKLIKTIIDLPESPEYFKLKIYTIKLLIKHREMLKQLNITLPEELVTIDGCVSGYQTDYIRGTELRKILFNNKFPIDFQIDCLKQIGLLLRQMAEIRKNTSLKNLYYGDIHEGNFIVNKEGIAYGVDTDSFCIGNNIPTSSFYSMEIIDSFPKDRRKYPETEFIGYYSARIIPDENLDLYCYIRMILNFMYGKEIDNLTPNRLLDYLDFLEFYGANLELLDSLAYICDDDVDNINPDYLLDHIKDIYETANIHYDKTGHLSKILK